MGQAVLYPEGRTTMNVVVSVPVKEGLRSVAQRQRQSVSQVVSIILEDYLRRRGELPAREEAAV